MSSIILPREIGPTPFLKYKDRWIELPYAAKIGLGNFFRIELYYPEHGVGEFVTPWFHNNITNVGLDMCATNNARYRACQVGSGNAPPQDTDTTLQNRTAGTGTYSTSANATYVAGPPAYLESYILYTFPVNGVIGNITEVGVGPSSASGQNLFSRELVRDETGAPIVITPPNNSQVRVHYRIRHYPPMTDVVGTVNGNIYGEATSREFTRRASQISVVSGSANALRWSLFYLNGGITIGALFGSTDATGGEGSNNPFAQLATGSLGSITGVPSGLQNNNSSRWTGLSETYNPGSFTRNIIRNYSHTTGALNIKSLTLGAGLVFTGSSSGSCQHQVEFDTAIAKGANDTFTVVTTVNWGRYTP